MPENIKRISTADLRKKADELSKQKREELIRKQELERQKREEAAQQNKIPNYKGGSLWQQYKAALESGEAKNADDFISKRNARNEAWNKVGYETLESDISKSNRLLSDTFGETYDFSKYYSPDSINKAANSVKGIRDRLNSLSEYLGVYGGNDTDKKNISDAIKAYDDQYNSLLKAAEYYGKFKNESDYNYRTDKRLDEDYIVNEYDTEAGKNKQAELKSYLDVISGNNANAANAAYRKAKERYGLDGMSGPEIKNWLTEQYQLESFALNNADRMRTAAAYKNLAENKDFLQGIKLGQAVTNPSFDEINAYQTELEQLSDKMTGRVGGGYTKEDEERYNYLKENPVSIKNQLLFYDDYNKGNGEYNAAPLAHGVTDYSELYNDIEFAKYGNRELLTDDERNTYYYLLGTQGKEAADQYLKDMQVTLDYRNTEQVKKYIEDIKNSKQFGNIIGDIVYSAASVPLNVFGGAISTVGEIGQRLDLAAKGDWEGKGYNPYSNYNLLSVAGQEARSLVSKDIEENTSWEILGQNVCSQIYQSIMSGVDSAFGMDTLGKLYTVSMGGSAAASKAAELYESGASSSQIYWESLLSGIAEATFEYLSIENLSSIKSIVESKPTTLKKAIKMILTQNGIEASEEVFTEIANMVIDKGIKKYDSDYDRKVTEYVRDGMTREEAVKKAAGEVAADIGWAGAGGFISGFASSTLTISGAYRAGKENADAQISAIDPGNAEGLYNNAKNIDYSILNDASEALKKGDAKAAAEIISEGKDWYEYLKSYAKEKYGKNQASEISANIDASIDNLNQIKNLISSGDINADSIQAVLEKAKSAQDTKVDVTSANDEKLFSLLAKGEPSNSVIEKNILKDRGTLAAFERLTGLRIGGTTVSQKRAAVREAFKAVSSSVETLKAAQNAIESGATATEGHKNAAVIIDQAMQANRAENSRLRNSEKVKSAETKAAIDATNRQHRFLETVRNYVINGGDLSGFTESPAANVSGEGGTNSSETKTTQETAKKRVRADFSAYQDERYSAENASALANLNSKAEQDAFFRNENAGIEQEIKNIESSDSITAEEKAQRIGELKEAASRNNSLAKAMDDFREMGRLVRAGEVDKVIDSLRKPLKKMGVNIEVVDNVEAADGMKSGAYFDKSTNTIKVSRDWNGVENVVKLELSADGNGFVLNSGKSVSFDRAVTQTIAHEIAHADSGLTLDFIKAVAGTQYDAFDLKGRLEHPDDRSWRSEDAQKEENWRRYVDAYTEQAMLEMKGTEEQRRASAEKVVNDAYIFEEIMADMFGAAVDDMGHSGKAGENIFWAMNRNKPGIIKRILNALERFIARIRGKDAYLAVEQRQAAERLRDMLTGELKRAYGTDVKSGTTSETRSSSKDTDNRWSLVGEKILGFYDSVLDMKDREKISKRKVDLGGISDSHRALLEKTLLSELGVSMNLADYTLWIDGSGIRHIEERHGKNGSGDHSMGTEEDIRLIPWAANNATEAVVLRNSKGAVDVDSVYKNADGSPAPKIKTSTPAGDNTFYVIESVPDSVSKRIYIKSAYKRKSSSDQVLNMESDDSPQRTPKASHGNTASKNSISQDSRNVNRQFSEISDAQTIEDGGTVENDSGEFIAESDGNGGTRWSLSTYESSGRETLRQYLDGQVSESGLTEADAKAEEIRSALGREESEKRFSLSSNVEQTKDLISVHNMTTAELEKSLDLGGLPMPSIAIIKAADGHSEYGDVSLVFGKDTIDPKKSARNKVYGGDAWTPTFPKIEYKANEKVGKRIRDKYYDLSRKYGYDNTRALYNYAQDLSDVLTSEGGEKAMIDKLYGDTGMMQIYLMDTGRERVSNVNKETKTALTDGQVRQYENLIGIIGRDRMNGFAKKDGEEFSDLVRRRKAFIKENEAGIRKAFEKTFVEDGMSAKDAAEVSAELALSDLRKYVLDTFNYIKNGAETVKTEFDSEATDAAIKKAADGEGYRKWINNLFGGAEEKSGIRNSKDAYTASGNRRSFEALHWENNLENIVKAMLEQDETGGAFFSGTGIWGVSAKKYNSISEIKNDSSRLRTMNEAEYNALKEQYGARMQEIAQTLIDPKNDNYFIASDDAYSLIVDAVRNSKDESGILRYLKKYNSRATEKTASDIAALVRDIAEMPTGYFEAKPQRAVGFDEVKAVILPDSASGELVSRLESYGINTVTYKAGDENSRLEALNGVRDVRFSLTRANDEYMKAVESGNVEEQQRLVDEAAENAGYDSSILLHHGTSKFGFTKIDVAESDDGISFFATDKLDTAASYIPYYENGDAYDGIREIGKRTGKNRKVLTADSSIEDFLKYLKGVYPEEYRDARVITKEERYKFAEWDVSDAVKQAKRLLQYSIPKNVEDLVNMVIESEDNKSQWEGIARAYGSFKDIPEITYNGRYFNDASNIWYNLQDRIRLLNIHLTQDLAIVNELPKSKEELLYSYEQLTGGENVGIYGLYAKHEGQLVIRGGGSNWNNIPLGDITEKFNDWWVNEKGHEPADNGFYTRGNTRNIAEFAKFSGYRSVCFMDVYDIGTYGGGHGDLADIYAFFYPESDVKSADPITYDDSGNVIPLTERFDSGNRDIRWSLAGTDKDRADAAEFSDSGIRYSLRKEDPPKKTLTGYKVFVVKNGKLYPPMVANPDAADTPVGVWLNADIGAQAPDSKTGRKQVKAGGKGTQGGSGSLAFRPGWHLGETPLATQFDRTNPETGKRELFPENFVWAECEIAADKNYQEEAMSYGYTKSGKFQHSLAGLPKLPVDGYYKYRTNPNPDTVPWLITGAMKVNRLLDDEEVNRILESKGLPPKNRVGGNKTLADLGLEETAKRLNGDGNKRYSLVKSAQSELKALQKENEKLRQDVDDLKQELQLTHGRKLSRDALISSIQKILIDGYGVKLPAKELYPHVTNLYDMFYNNTVDGRRLKKDERVDTMRIIEEMDKIVDAVIENAVGVDDTYVEMKKLLPELRNTKLVVPVDARADAAQSAGFENWAEFRKANFGRVGFANEGLPVDTYYTELSERYPELFPDGITHPGEQAAHIADVVNTIRESGINEYQLYDIEDERIRTSIKNDVMDIIGNAEKLQTFADRSAQKVEDTKLAEAMHYGADIAKLKRLNAEKVAGIKAENRKRLSDMRRKYQDRVESVRERYAEARANRSEKQKQTVLRNKVLRKYTEASSMLDRPTTENHFTEAMRKPLMEFLAAVDITTGKSMAKQGVYDRILRVIDAAKNETAESGKNGLDIAETDLNVQEKQLIVDSGLLERMSAWVEANQGKKLTELSSAQLEELNGIFNQLKHLTAEIKRLYDPREGLAAKSWQAQKEIGLAQTKERKQVMTEKEAHARDVTENVGMGAYDANNFFNLLGSDVMNEVHDGLRVRQRKATENVDMFVNEMADATGGEISKKWHGKNADVITLNLSHGKVQMIPSQLITAYLMLNQKDSRNCLFDDAGGAVIGKFTAKLTTQNNDSKNLLSKLKNIVRESYVFEAGKKFVMNEADEAKIISAMNEYDPRLITVADKISAILNGSAARLGNEVSMAMYGYKKFTTENYFPMRTTDDYRAIAVDPSYEVKNLLGISFAQERTHRAGKPLVIEDVFDVVGRHLTNMAQYNAFAQEIDNIRKMYTLRLGDGTSLKQRMIRAYGKGADEYFVKLLSNLSGPQVSPKNAAESVSAKLTSRYKAAAVAGNLSVVLKQPMSIFRALPEFTSAGLKEIISLKEDFTNLRPKNLDKSIQEMLKYSGIAKMKNWGSSENITKKSFEELYNKNAITGGRKFNEKLTSGAENADMWTWAKLWRMSKAEIDAQGKYTAGSKEYFEAVDRKFSDVIGKTQVVQSALDSSMAVQNANVIQGMLYAFQNEPLKQFNYLSSVIRDARRGKPGAKAKLAKTIISSVANTIAVSAISTAMSLLRGTLDRDDDDELWDDILKSFGGNVLADVLSGGLAPIWWAIEGFGSAVFSGWFGNIVERLDTAALTDLGDLINKYLIKQSQGGFNLGTVQDIVNVASNLFGWSAKNIFRDVKGALDRFHLDLPISPMAKYKYLKLWKDVELTNKAAVTEAYYDVLRDAVDRGRYSDYVKIKRDMIYHGYTETKIKNAVMKSSLMDDLYELKKVNPGSYKAKVNSIVNSVSAVSSLEGREMKDFIESAMKRREREDGGSKTDDEVYDEMHRKMEKEVKEQLIYIDVSKRAAYIKKMLKTYGEYGITEADILKVLRKAGKA